MARRQEKNWTTWALAICGIAAIGWVVNDQFLSSHNKEHVEHAADLPQIAPAPAAPKISVPAGTSVKAPIGHFSIQAERVSNTTVNLTITSDTKDTYHFKKSSVGQRLMIPTHDGTYYLDIVRIQGKAVDLTMGKQ